MLENCPHCGTNLIDKEIPIESLKRGLYGEWDGKTPQYYYRTVGVEIPGVYDGTLYWQCPDCDEKWHKFPEGSRLHRRAAPYVNMLWEAGESIDGTKGDRL
jgi:hypothetical protein